MDAVSDVLANSDFISRTIGMSNSYEDIMFIVQALGREPVSLLGKNYAFIYDHVRRNYLQGTYVDSKYYDNCHKFTFYKEAPTVKFADPYNDQMNKLGKWIPNMTFQDTAVYSMGGGASIHYSESDDDKTNNRQITYKEDLDSGNPGTHTNSIYSYGSQVSICDLVGKTNSNFNHGKYQTLIARFHTNSPESKDKDNSTQTAFSNEYGQSHGRNLLKKEHKGNLVNGYDNPYCRVWTYHHQYNQVKRQIRPLVGENGNGITQELFESYEISGNYDTVGFRTLADEKYGIKSGSKRLDDYGVLNYQNGTVNIAPTAKITDYFYHKNNEYEKGIIETKKCMFSIENLAWRDGKSRNDEFDPYGLSPEQRGPLGGRIMWFPPYDLKFNEDVNVNWNSNKFIGRGEDIYTYTNTERRGNLSFTLLIDHPSILDYWTGLNRNGMKNQGNGLASGNSGGIDNVNNQENTLLRFFSGCEILSAKPQLYRNRMIEPITVESPKPTETMSPEEADESKKETYKLYAILYFPNNYSGQDDDAEFAINYLMNGIGTQKRIDNGIAVDFAPDPNASQGIGYEMSDSGISIVNWDAIHDKIKYGTNSTITDELKEGKAEFIYDKKITYGGNNGIILAKQIGDKASLSDDDENYKSEWKNRRWFYRVDNDTINERLVNTPWNYIDGSKYNDESSSYHLNSTGYSWVKENISAFNLNENDDLVSFVDLYVALNKEASKNSLITNKTNENNVTKIRKIANGEDGYNVVSVSFRGHNSSHGRNKNANVNIERNSTLSSERALTFKNWMAKMGFPKVNEAGNPITISQANENDNHKKDTIDSPYIKAWRSASVVIEYTKENIMDAATSEATKVDKNGKTIVDRVEIKNNESSKRKQWWELSEDTNNLILDTYGKTIGKRAPSEEAKNWIGDALNELSDYEYDKEKVVNRYDNEGEFFETLTSDAPFLHHLISEKIKYFDPAFHSISPEGFNARLTFLHQCTRQGSTVGKSSFDSSSAYNLAFGRPPVCVLRLGDFFNTKIVITSLTIQYEDPQWDMNPEGIGMMPMFANVTINFNFLGGSDLAGPIARLQNAVSFNYYANTSVYDNRAEVVEYENNGSGNEKAFKGYVYPRIYNKLENK